MRVSGLPGNESLAHFVLKWAAYHVLTLELACPLAMLEAGVGVGRASRQHWPRHDALGVRFQARRAPVPWEEVPADGVRLQVLDGATGVWRDLLPSEPFRYRTDATHRAFERGPGAGQTPLREVAPGRAPGTVRVRRVGSERQECGLLCGADAKQSRGDLQAWLRDAAVRLRSVQLFVLVVPVGMATPAELPPRVGLAEVDLERLLGPDGRPAIRMTRWPEPLRRALPWPPERTAAFQRHAYYAMHGLFQRQLFWFLAQEALDRRRGAERGTVREGAR